MAELRSIPACAGKPQTGDIRAHETEVDPRVCGETIELATDVQAFGGRSPRVRGNLRVLDGDVQIAGSIPACAGKPSRMTMSSACIRVDPRVCGETASV